MKQFRRLFTFLFLLMLVSGSSTSAQDSQDILRIRRQFKSWQEVLNKEALANGKNFFHIYSGENYQNERWVTEVNKKMVGSL
jgi:hypothetical protein